jgi:hypothetical protein
VTTWTLVTGVPEVTGVEEAAAAEEVAGVLYIITLASCTRKGGFKRCDECNERA